MRTLIKTLLAPALKLSCEDREYTLEVQLGQKSQEQRLALLEKTVFDVDTSEGPVTVFDYYSKKINDLERFLTCQTQKLAENQTALKVEIDNRLAKQD